MKATRTPLHSLLAVAAGIVFLASAAAVSAQVQTATDTTSGTATKQVKVEKGTVVMVSGNDVWVKDEAGQIRHFPNVPDSVRVNVNGQQLGVHDLKPGMTVERTTVTTTTPKVITTTQTVTGKVWHVNPPLSVILTLEDGKNQEFKIPKGQQFNVNGQMTDAFGLKKGMTISATKIVEVPETVVTQQRELAGQMPPPPPPAPNQPVLIAVMVPVPAPAPAPEAAPAPAPSLPKTGSSLPFLGLLGLALIGASFGMRSFRRS